MNRKPTSWRQKDVNGPPGGEPWVWTSAELLTSPAWRARSRYCITLIEFLQKEHMAHGGQENGALLAPYAQVQAAGIPRGCIRPAIEEAEALKLIEVKRGGKKNHVQDHLSRYRLTFYCTREKTVHGKPFYSEPTDEWKHLTAEMANEIERQMRVRRRLGKRGKAAVKNSFSEPHGGSVSEPHGGTEGTENQRFRSEPHGGSPYNILAGSGVAVAVALDDAAEATTTIPSSHSPELKKAAAAPRRRCGLRDHNPGPVPSPADRPACTAPSAAQIDIEDAIAAARDRHPEPSAPPPPAVTQRTARRG